MKLRSFIFAAVAAVMAFSACEQKEDLGTPNITISTDELNFDQSIGEQAITLTATRDWSVVCDEQWVQVSPDAGVASSQPQTVTVTVLKNEGMNRSVDLKFTIGTKSKYLTVNQAGPQGSADALVAYSNNFDVKKAENNSGWPYLDSNLDLWDNKKGEGASTVTYAVGGKMSVRTSGKLSNDASGYSHYAGSGMNKVFFGAATSILKIENITLNGTNTDYALSFGAQKYLQDGDSNFSWDEFKVYVSNDSQKWAAVTMTFPQDADINGDWNHATANITLPAGTTKLSLAFVCTASSAYSLDDVLLAIGSAAGQTIDFSTGIEISGTTAVGSTGDDNTGGDDAGSTTEAPATLVTATIAEFLAAAEDDTWYQLTGEIISIEKETYGNFTIKDATGQVYVYGMTNGWVGSNNQSFAQIGLKVTDTVTLGTKRTSYNGTPQGGGNKVPAYYISHVPGEGTGEEPEPPVPGEAGEFDPQGITWTLGTKAYDKTSGTNAQTGTVNGVAVADMLKLGTASLVGDATLHVPAGTKKVGFYCIAWSGKNSTEVKFSINGTAVKTLTPAANSGATGNPPYTITVGTSDYYELEMPSTSATDVKVETTNASQGRVIFIGLKAITE